MAIVILNQSTCSFCGNLLLEGDEVIAWKPFLAKKHKFWEFSDSGMHRSCFDKWEYKKEFEHLYKYQPLVDFNSPDLKEQIKKRGMPEWLKEIKEYRKSNPSPS